VRKREQKGKGHRDHRLKNKKQQNKMSFECYGCKKLLTEDHFSQRQLNGESVNRRCKDCIAKKIGDPVKELKEKKRQEQREREQQLWRERFTPPADPEQICMNCAINTQPLKIFQCPFCVSAEYPCNRTKLIACPHYRAGSRDCIEKTISQHFESGDCQKQLQVHEITISYTRRPVDSYDDGDEENIETTLLYPVRSLDTKLGEIETWFYPKRYLFSNDTPSYQLELFSERQTIREVLQSLSYEQAIKFRFCGV